MMKPFFTIALFLLIQLHLQAQVQTQATAPQQTPASQYTPAPTNPRPQKARKFFAGLSLGPSFPTGKFANKDFRDTTAGLAMAGPSLSLSAGYLFTRSVGVMVLLGGQENKIDPNSITRYLNQQYGDTIGTYVSTRSWKTGRILAGGIFKFPLSQPEKLFFQAKILAGMLKTSYPGYTYAYGIIIRGPSNPNNYAVSATRQGPPLKWAFCYQANAGLGWQLSKRISLVGDVSYFHAEPYYRQDHYLIFMPNGTYTDRGPFERKYPVSSINGMAGAEITF